MFCVFCKNTTITSALCFFYYLLLVMHISFIKAIDCYSSVSQVYFVLHPVAIRCNYCVLFRFDVCELPFTEIMLKHTM